MNMVGMRRCGFVGLMAICVALLGVFRGTNCEAAQEEGSVWIGLAAGMLLLEGDEPVESSEMVRLSLGYEFTEAWSLECSLMSVPKLDVRYRNSYDEKIPRADFEETSAYGLSLDGLYHFHRAQRLDPFIALGIGFLQYEDAPGDDDFDPSIRLGAGVLYHFSESWAIRAEGRALVAGLDTEVNATVDIGIVWRRKPYSYGRALTGDLDSDSDGVTDAEESRRGTDPYSAKE
jgi:hypothetical protein